MSAYILARVDVTDPEQFKKYLQETPKTIALYGGKYIARGGEVVALEGVEESRRIVLIEFPSLDKASEWYCSAEYQKAKILREGAAIGSIIAIEGC